MGVPDPELTSIVGSPAHDTAARTKGTRVRAPDAERRQVAEPRESEEPIRPEGRAHAADGATVEQRARAVLAAYREQSRTS